MGDDTMAIAGVQSCGCITYVNCRPGDLDREAERALARIIRGGGTVRRATVDELRADPNFLNLECPHDPKGWEREVFKPNARCEKASYRNSSRKRVKVQVVPDGFRNPAGEIVKCGQKWWATPGRFDEVEPESGPPSARCLDTQETPRIHPLGPFDREREAKQALIDNAVVKSERRRPAETSS